MNTYIFNPLLKVRGQLNKELLERTTTEAEKLFMRFLKENGIYGAIMRKYGTLATLRRNLRWDIKSYALCLSQTEYAHIAHRWIDFAKDLIRKDDERRQKELEERLKRRTLDMMASKYGFYGTYASNDMWYDLNYYRPSPSIFNNLSYLDSVWLEPGNNSNL